MSEHNPFDPAQWRTVPGFEDLTDITYHRHVGEGRANGIVRIAYDRGGGWKRSVLKEFEAADVYLHPTYARAV